MKVRPSIQFKAVFLTFVLFLNTIVGFACAVGADMGFNSGHHQNQPIAHTTNHLHESTKPHDHAQHVHGLNVSSDHLASESSKDNCCADDVAKLTQADKLYQPGFNYSLLSLSFFILPSTLYLVGNSRTFPVNVSNTYFVRHCRPPIRDIRIAIQSFQI